MRQVVVYPGEDNYWVVECPSLPGCVSQGKNRAEAMKNIKDAIEAYVAALEEDDLEIPEDCLEALHDQRKGKITLRTHKKDEKDNREEISVCTAVNPGDLNDEA